MSEAALLDLLGLNTHFPAPMPRTPDPWDLIAEDDEKREAHVARITPDLVRLYAITPDKLLHAYRDVSFYASNNPALIVATATRDALEVGRMVLACIEARITEMAEDDAETDGYRVIPERPIP
jgi:hypothetical protein